MSQSRSSFGPLLPVRQRAQREPCGGGGDQTDRASLEGNVRKVGSIPKTKMADAATTHTPPAEPRTTSSISSQLAGKYIAKGLLCFGDWSLRDTTHSATWPTRSWRALVATFPAVAKAPT